MQWHVFDDDCAQAKLIEQIVQDLIATNIPDTLQSIPISHHSLDAKNTVDQQFESYMNTNLCHGA